MNAILAFLLRLLLILLAYTFLGWIIYTIFMDLKRGNSLEKEKIITPIVLSLQTEDEEITKRFRQSEIFLGRDPSADFPLQNETISLRHCKLMYRQNQWWVEDLKSTNGTFINQALITTGTILTDGDILTLGKVSITIRINQNIILE
ncbi:MAG: FHA domain-containing protein [Chloroflexota bacterium]|nr:FHA domain-containing protein [Chloroflexota bacterium]